MSDFEDFEIIKCDHVRRKSVYSIMRKRQHFEIDQFIGSIGEGGDAVL
jgi:hypothetical protein